MTVRVFVDGRWLSQKGQGVVTFLRDLHRAAIELETSRPDGTRLEFVFGVESMKDVDESWLGWGAKWVEVGRRGMAWRWLCYPAWLADQGFHIAHFQYVCPLLQRDVKYVVAMHDVLYLRIRSFFSWRYIVPRALMFGISARKADRVLTVSDQSSQDIARFFRRRHGVVKVPCGVPAWRGSLSAAVSLPNEIQAGSYLLSVGRLEPRKNFVRLAQAFEQSGLAAAGAKLVVAGFCPPEGRGIAEVLKKTPSVIWLDRVDDGQLKSLYLNARAFVFPSFGEGFGLPVIEAMYAGLPVGLSNAYPLDDVREIADVVFDPVDVGDIERALTKLWCQVDKMHASRVESVLANYQWEYAARIYIDMLLDLASPKQGISKA